MDLPTMKIKEGGPKENGRVWLSPETMLSIEAAPGAHCLLSIPTQETASSENLPADSIPSTVQHKMQKRRNLRAAWGVIDTGGEELGAYCVGCEVWPNGGLKKGEIEISQCLHRHLHCPLEGSLVTIQHLNDFKLRTQSSQHSARNEKSINQWGQLQSREDRSSSVPAVCLSIGLRFLQRLEKDGATDGWLEEMKDIGSLQMNILKTLIQHQLHRRLMLTGNVVSLSLLGSTMLLSVDQLNINEGSVVVALIDGDRLEIELEMDGSRSHEDGFLEQTRAAAEESAEGSQKEASIDGALDAARTGLRVLEGCALDRCILTDAVQSTLQTSVVLPLMSPSVFTSSGLHPPRGLILHGPPGSGKTLTAVWVATTAKAHLFVINGPALLSEYYGAAEAHLSAIFAAAKKLSPSLIFLDEMDAVMPSRNGSQGMQSTHDASIRLVTTLLTQFDLLEGHRVIVLGATNRLEVIDDALRRPGRFDRELELTVPDPASRQALLHAQLRDIHHSLKEDDVTGLAFDAHGYLPADLSAVCREASLVALRRFVSEGAALLVTAADFRKALSTVPPSGLREWQSEIPSVRWEDVGGLDAVKQQLRESVEWPYHRASALAHLGTSAPRGILLFGPPGCSKTMLAKAVATETKMNFIAVIGSELLSMFVGESEKAIARLFVRARQMAPCIIFMDEVDGLLSHRAEDDDGTALGQRVLSQMLSEMDGIRDRGNVIIIGATNKPQLIDPAMLRPGRFDRLIFVPPPDQETREAILEIQINQMSTAADVDVDQLATRTVDYTGADLAAVCREAGICALESDIHTTHIHMCDFLQAIEMSSPSLDGQETQQMEIYRSFQRGAKMESVDEKSDPVL